MAVFRLLNFPNRYCAYLWIAISGLHFTTTNRGSARSMDCC